MKKFNLFILIFICSTSVFAQEIEFNLSYSNSTLRRFKNSVGFDIGYSKVTPGRKVVGVFITNLFNSFPYDWNTKPDFDPNSYLLMESDPKSFCMGINFYYGLKIKNNEHMEIIIAPTLGLNYFHIKESTHRFPHNSIEEDFFETDEWFNNRSVFGVLLKSTCKNVINDKINLSYSIHPQIGSFEKFATNGGIDPWAFLSVQFKVGINYNIKNISGN